jgi:hypothetical protein
VKLYTIQPEFKLKEFEKTGILKSGDKIMEDSFLESYAWLENKMREILPLPEIECNHPLWSWFKYRGKRKPDLRFSGYSNKGDVLYRIEFEIEDNKVLLTDFSDWHLILNSSDEDKLLNSSSLPLDCYNKEEIEEILKEGWEILDDKLIYNWDNVILDVNSVKSDIQATVWFVNLDQVNNITKFKCK